MGQDREGQPGTSAHPKSLPAPRLPVPQGPEAGEHAPPAARLGQGSDDVITRKERTRGQNRNLLHLEISVLAKGCEGDRAQVPGEGTATTGERSTRGHSHPNKDPLPGRAGPSCWTNGPKHDCSPCPPPTHTLLHARITVTRSKTLVAANRTVSSKREISFRQIAGAKTRSQGAERVRTGFLRDER